MQTGSLEFEISTDSTVLGNLSHREIANAIRAFPDANPTKAEVDEFERMMKEARDADPFEVIEKGEQQDF